MHDEHDAFQRESTAYRQSFCLTDLSTLSLIGFALAGSVLLWLCIWAVL